MALFIKKEDIPQDEFDMINTSFSSSMVYGSGASLLQSSRPPGYHSKPHLHESEQINLCTGGELYFYTDKQAYKLTKGDVIRVPPNVIHWAENKGDAPCSQITVHTPGFQKGTPGAVGLFDEGETVSFASEPENIYVDPDTIDIARVEGMKAIGED